MKINNFNEGAKQLAIELKVKHDFDKSWQVIQLGKLAQAVAVEVSLALNLELINVDVMRGQDENGFLLEPKISLPDSLGLRLIVCDIGVETGKTAIEFASLVRDKAPQANLALAALVIPLEQVPLLKTQYQTLISIKSPIARRGLHWEFEHFG
jgi:predicted phosphoribosyltransferase